jgi:hypothetical protein
MKCPKCKFYNICGGRLNETVEDCVRFKSVELTNEEYLRSCNTEELAEFLNLIIRVGPYENEPKDFWEHVYGRGGENGAKSIVMWLKQPHRGEMKK